MDQAIRGSTFSTLLKRGTSPNRLGELSTKTDSSWHLNTGGINHADPTKLSGSLYPGGIERRKDDHGRIDLDRRILRENSKGADR
jgi:hypothetical protein